MAMPSIDDPLATKNTMKPVSTLGNPQQGGISQFSQPPAIPEVKTAQTVTREVNQPTDTVQGQLSSLLAKDNPLMTSARTKATDYMNSRGLQNSSMAAQAGEQAVIETAMPIAQQDASTYFNQGLTNQGEQNTTNRFNVGEQNKPILQGQIGEQQLALQSNQQTHELRVQEIDQQFKSGLLDREQAHDLKVQSIEQDFKNGLLTREQAHDLKKQSIDNDFKSGLLDREQAHDLKVQTIDQDFKSGLLTREQAQQMRVVEFEADARERLATLDSENRLELEKIAQDSAKVLNVSRDAMDAFKQTLVNVSNIQADPNTTNAQKKAQVDSERKMLQNAISLAEGVTGTDLSGAINWTVFDTVVADPAKAAPSSAAQIPGSAQARTKTREQMNGQF